MPENNIKKPRHRRLMLNMDIDLWRRMDQHKAEQEKKLDLRVPYREIIRKALEMYLETV